MSDNLYDLINFGELPNVNVVGNLTSLYVTGNTLLGANISTAVGVSGDMYVDGLFEFSNVGNIIIYGGNNGDVLTTDGNGFLSWTAGGGGGNVYTVEGTGYSICDAVGNTVTLPVYANSTSTRNIPLKYVGNTISDLWPYGNGSVVANAIPPGYNINSTAAFTPANSAILYIPTSTASYDGYFKVIDSNTGSNAWGNTSLVEITLRLDCYSNTSNTQIQLTPFIYTSGNNNQLQTQDQVIYNVAEFPKQTGIHMTYMQTLPTNITKVGWYIRNISSSTEVTVGSGSIDVIQIEQL